MVTVLTDAFMIIGMVDLTMPGALLVNPRVVSRLLRRRRRVCSLVCFTEKEVPGEQT